MTPAERAAVVELRRSRGFPLHKPPHPDQAEGWYFITAATYEHHPHFAAPPELTALERRLLVALTASGLGCAGWVVMPNHYHAVVYTRELALVGSALGPVHGRSAHYANQRDRAAGRRVWFKYSDRKVRSERHFWACLHYVLFNPVKHGYVTAMAEWPWSSYQELVAKYGLEWVDDLARVYPLKDFGEKWDP
jgi:putative transposase